MALWLSVKGAPVATDADKVKSQSGAGNSYFTRRFFVPNGAKGAKLFCSALGVMDCFINAHLVGDYILSPGFTQFDASRTVYEYDILPYLKKGEENFFLAEVGPGWWSDAVNFYRGKRCAFWGRIVVECEDGVVEYMTDLENWNGTIDGPVVLSGIYDGEVYDARKLRPFFGCSGYVEENCECRARLVPHCGGEVYLRYDLMMGAVGFDAGVLCAGEEMVLDFGQNLAAVPYFKFRAKRGVVLKVLFGEMIYDRGEKKGQIYRENLRIPESGMMLSYTFGSDGVEEYMPRFTYFGYRYISVVSTDCVEILEVKSVPVSSVSKAMECGHLEVGRWDVNRLILNSYFGELSNYLSVPTDCPQRNERFGWLADAQVFADTGAFFARTNRFFRKWMRDVRDTIREGGSPDVVAPNAFVQYFRIGWSDALVIVPYVMWNHFGDLDIVRDNFEAMAKFVRRIGETKYRFSEHRNECGWAQYLDWLSLERFEQSAKCGAPISGGEEEFYCDYLGAAYAVMDAEMLSKMARAIGENGDEFEQIARDMRAYMKKRFFVGMGGILPEFLMEDMQTPSLFALYLDLVTGDAYNIIKARLLANLKKRNYRLSTGFLGTSILLPALCKAGLGDVAMEVFLNEDFPGWLYSVHQGATTIWERWNSYSKVDGFGDAKMNSFNHYAYGSVVGWIWRYLAGINIEEEDGKRRVVLSPHPDKRLGWLSARLCTDNGEIVSKWHYEGDRCVWDYVVPDGYEVKICRE